MGIWAKAIEEQPSRSGRRKPLAGMRGDAVLALVLAAGLIAGCGVVYEPQEFAKSRFSYGYKGGFGTEIDLVPLTFQAARAANADGYTPRPLPTAFSEGESAPAPSLRARIAAAGLDRVDPPTVFELPAPFRPYDGTREVLPVGTRNENVPPLPVLDLSQGPLEARPRALPEALPASGTGTVSPLDPVTLRRRARDNPLPRVAAPPYRIGPGDVLSLQSQDRVLPSLGTGTGGDDTSSITGMQNLLVQDNGRIFIPIVGAVEVAGLTLREARDRVSERLLENQIGIDTGIQITKFGSKRIAVSGISGNQIIPVTVTPTTLGEAITLSGGFGTNPDNVIVRVLREGEIYEMSGDRIAGSGDLARRILLDGDIVSVTPAYDVELALTYFDQQLRLRALEREALTDALARRAEERAAETVERDDIRLRIQLENYRLQADRLRQEAQIGRLASARQADRLNEDARLANILARQTYLDKLRALEEINRQALRDLRRESRQVALANQAERSRARDDLRQLLELELRELELESAADLRAQALFGERLRLGAVERDYVTVAGETQRQTTVPLPFEGRMTLNRVLYEETNGINTTTGDTSEIYVFRVPRGREDGNRLVVFHLDASNPAALTVASVFEMRPNDVVYVNPQPITTWNRVLSQILPSTGLLQTAVGAVR